MATAPREIGTLVVVVLKANHLPNKRHIGKQDPYCAVTFGGQTRRTKAIKKGGQHPEWDEEIRFQLYEDDQEPSEVELVTGGTPPPLPPKNDKSLRIKGGMFMKLAAYADDAREPDLIGEGLVDLTEVITKGESDEWYTLTYKDRFAGKVYLEMTLYSNEPEPPKKKAASILTNNSEYIGPGVFVEESSAGATNRIVSASMTQDHNRRQSDSYSLRPSSSLAQLDLYQAPYEQNQSVDSLTRNFGEFGVSNGRRRETLPSSVNSYRSTSSTGLSTVSSRSSLYEPNGSTFRPVTPNGQPYPGEYDPLPLQPSSYRPPPPVRKTRYSIPT
ncbi:C2 domain-containing protein, partial [Lentinula aff. detonsa]